MYEVNRKNILFHQSYYRKYISSLTFFMYLISSLKGSAKLEKAEILQMTVDHLKMLQATGGKGT